MRDDKKDRRIFYGISGREDKTMFGNHDVMEKKGKAKKKSEKLARFWCDRLGPIENVY